MPGSAARTALCLLGRDVGDCGRQNGTDGEADLHDDLRARQPGRRRYPRVPRHARLVPVRAACPLAHAGDRACRGESLMKRMLLLFAMTITTIAGAGVARAQT